MMTAQEKPDMKTLNFFRAQFHEANKKWCPDEKIRLKMFVEEHFAYRLIDRFKPAISAATLLKEVMQWIDKNYCTLLFDNVVYGKRDYRIQLKTGVAVFVLFNGTLRIRTCFIPGNE